MMRQHHALYPMLNCNVLILSVTRITNTEVIQAFRNPSLLPESDLYNEQIIEVTSVGMDSTTIAWEWNVKDHILQDPNNTKDNIRDVSLNPEKMNTHFQMVGLEVPIG